MLQLKKVSERVNTLKTIGTVASFIGKDGAISIASKNNFNGVVNEQGVRVFKNVSLKLENKSGDYEYLTCSKPVSAWLREKTGVELQERMNEVASLLIYETPQINRDVNSESFNEPVMELDEETGEMKQVLIYSIGFNGGSDMSGTKVKITDEMIKKEISTRKVNYDELVAL